jgi:hypothetical protein
MEQKTKSRLKPVIFLLMAGLLLYTPAFSQPNDVFSNTVRWTTQSRNSSESMPVGGGDIGLNVWVENGEIYFYLSRSGTFDENNTLLKLGRVKVKFLPNPFAGKTFRQELILKDGYVHIKGSDGKLNAELNVWVDVFKPVVNIDITSNQKIVTEASYESWRFQDRITKGKENNQNSYKWAPQGSVQTSRDEIGFIGDQITFRHKNKAATVFDAAVRQQGLEMYKAELYNPLKELQFGGLMRGSNMTAAGTYTGQYLSSAFKGWKLRSQKSSRSQHISIQLYSSADRGPSTGLQQNQAKAIQEAPDHQYNPDMKGNWIETIQAANDLKYNPAKSFKASKKWWNAYWDRSFIHISSADPAANQLTRNYQLFRYMLGCNAYGDWPTKFNGGLFTYDPELTDSTLKYTPDFRNWGGGTHTAQNQRLVYWPMLKSGDFDMMKPQFDFYANLLKNAEIRTAAAWGHKGASFTEQIENFGLPNPAEYGWKRPAGYDKGMEYNAWLEYEWDTILEFCMMILETERYNQQDIQGYIPLIESSLDFFKAHYTYLAERRGAKSLDANGHLVLYPGSAAETYKMAYNSSSTIAGLKTVLQRLLELKSASAAQRKKWQNMLKMIPPLSFSEFEGKTTISPARSWERINNTESPQLYPVFPWGIYGVGEPGLDTARNTYMYDTDVIRFRSHVGWKQDNIFAARLGLTAEASRLTVLKLKDSGRRFPAFWGPGYDWTPDHNWGGSGMIGLQEMLMQCKGKKILLFPAWPKEWDVHFKLHAPYQTTVEGILKDGKITQMKVFPEHRKSDVVNMLQGEI